MATKAITAAAAIKLSLEQVNEQTGSELSAMLDRIGVGGSYLEAGKRVLRDSYGDHALVKQRVHRNGVYRIEYVFDPAPLDARPDMLEQTRRISVEVAHLNHLVEWLEATYGAQSGVSRRVRRYMKAIVAEVEDLLDVL